MKIFIYLIRNHRVMHIVYLISNLCSKLEKKFSSVKTVDIAYDYKKHSILVYTNFSKKTGKNNKDYSNFKQELEQPNEDKWSVVVR